MFPTQTSLIRLRFRPDNALSGSPAVRRQVAGKQSAEAGRRSFPAKPRPPYPLPLRPPAACPIPNAARPFCRSQTFEVFFDLPYSFPFIALQTSLSFPHAGFSTLPRYRGAEVRFDTI